MRGRRWPMRRIWVITRRAYQAKVRSKAFLISRTLNVAVQQHRLRAAGLDPELVRRTTAPVRLESLGLYGRDAAGKVASGDRSSQMAASLLPIGVLMVMFLAIVMSQTMMHSTLE